MHKKKTYVLMVAKTFQKDHPRAGELTNFADHILNGIKIHTLRSNYDRWEKIVNEVNAGQAILSLREWIDKPYRSKQREIVQLYKLGIERVSCLPSQSGWLEVEDGHIHKNMFAQNDGLTRSDFDGWFPEAKDNMPLIHFTDFRYCS